MSIVSVSTIWQLVCPVTEANGLVASSTHTFPPDYTPTATFDAVILASGAAAMSALDVYPTGILPTDIGIMAGPRLTVAVPVHTTLTIDIFPNPIPTPVATYRPQWTVTDDGSMVTPIYLKVAAYDHTRIILIGFLLAVFLRNVLLAFDYLRRGRARDKTLFYLLLASQLFGPIAFITLIVGILSPTASCAAVNALSSFAMEASSSILITGILGIKAYRCLNRSRTVLLVTWALQIVSLVFFFLDIIKTGSARDLIGNCTLNYSATTFMPAWTSVMFSETGFLSLCFLLAVWRSSRSAAAQGRMSLVLSQDGSRMSAAPFNAEEAKQASRGWWDYIPETAGAPQMQQNRNTLHPPTGAINDRFTQPPPLNGLRRTASHNSNTPILRQDDDPSPVPVNGWRGRASRVFSRFSMSARHAELGGYRRTSSPSYREPQFPDTAAPPTREKAQKHLTNSTVNSTTTFLRRRRSSAAPGGYGQAVDLEDTRWRKRLPNMLRVVIRDELFYTAAITISCVISAIIVAVAARSDVIWSGMTWLQINWAVTSVLVMQSYDHVVKRHEREKILQEPILAAPGPGAGWRDRTLQPSISILSARPSRRTRYRPADDENAEVDPLRRESVVSSEAGAVRVYSDPFSDYRSVVTHEPSRENDGYTIRGRPDSGTFPKDVPPLPGRTPSPTSTDAEHGRQVMVLEDDRRSTHSRLWLPSLATPVPELPAFSFEDEPQSSTTSSPSDQPYEDHPPWTNSSEGEYRMPIGYTSSTNLRSPTAAAFDFSMAQNSDTASGITRRSRSHDWNHRSSQ